MRMSLSPAPHRRSADGLHRSHSGRGWRAFGVLALACHLLVACTTWQVQTTPLAKRMQEDPPPSVRLWLSDNTRVDLHRPRWASDSIIGSLANAPESLTLPVASITGYAVRRRSTGKTVALTLGVVGLATLVVLAASCDCGGGVGGY